MNTANAVVSDVMRRAATRDWPIGTKVTLAGASGRVVGHESEVCPNHAPLIVDLDHPPLGTQKSRHCWPKDLERVP